MFFLDDYRIHEELAEEGQKVKEEMEAELKAMEAALNNEYGVDGDDLDSGRYQQLYTKCLDSRPLKFHICRHDIHN